MLRENSIHNVLDVFALTYKQIEELHYQDNKNTRIVIKLGQRNLLKILYAYHTKFMRENDPIALLGWVDMDQDKSNKFRLAYSDAKYNPDSPTTSAPKN